MGLEFLMGPLGGILASPQPQMAAPIPGSSPAGLDDILRPAPQPLQGGADADPSILERFLPQMAQQYAHGMNSYANAQGMADAELNRQKKHDFIDELTGNVLMPLSAKGLPGAAEMAMGESKRILNQLHDDRKGRIEHAETQGNIINNLAKIIKHVDPNDVDNLMKQREQMLREKQFGETQKQNQIGNDQKSAELYETTRYHGVLDKQHGADMAAQAKQHADQLAYQHAQLDQRAREAEQEAMRAKATNDLGRFNAMVNAAKDLRSEQAKTASELRAAKIKAVELEQGDRKIKNEQIQGKDAKGDPAMVLKYPDYQTTDAAGYLQQMGYGQPQQQGVVATGPAATDIMHKMGLETPEQLIARIQAAKAKLSKKK